MVRLSELISLVLAILVVIGLGFLARKFKLLKKEDARNLNQVIIYFALPAFIFNAVLKAKLEISLLIVPIFALSIISVCAAVAFILGKKIKLASATLGGFVLAAAIGNTGYIGFPLTQELFGKAEVVKAVFYDHFGSVLFIFTAGLYIAETYGKSGVKIHRLKEIASFPPLLAMLAAFLLRGVELPLFFQKSIEFLSGATIPLIMFSLGLTLEPGKANNYKFALFLLVLIKLLLGPVLILFAGRLISLPMTTLGVVVLETSMPTALITSVFGLKYELDTDLLSSAIMITTLVSMLTIPFWQVVVGGLS